MPMRAERPDPSVLLLPKAGLTWVLNAQPVCGAGVFPRSTMSTAKGAMLVAVSVLVMMPVELGDDPDWGPIPQRTAPAPVCMGATTDMSPSPPGVPTWPPVLGKSSSAVTFCAGSIRLPYAPAVSPATLTLPSAVLNEPQTLAVRMDADVLFWPPL